MSEETKEKLRQANLGKKASKESREKMQLLKRNVGLFVSLINLNHWNCEAATIYWTTW